MSGKAKARFLDFSISTASYNSGTQQFGAGQSMRGRARNTVGRQTEFSGDVAPYSLHQGNVSHVQSHAKWVTIAETEPAIATLAGSTGYAVTQIPINPGLATFAPVGSKVMQRFERYHLKKLKVRFIPTVSGYAAAGQTGRIVLGVVYDAASLPPQDVRSAESNIPNAPGYVTDLIELNVAVDRVERYTRSDRNPANTDIKTYDVGFIYIAVIGTPNTSQIGEVHVEYEFELRNILDNIVALPRNLVMARALCGAYSCPAGTFDYNFAFTSGSPVPSASVLTYDGLGTSLVSFTPAGGVAGNYLQLPLGRYLIQVNYQLSTAAAIQEAAIWVAMNGPGPSIANFPVSGARSLSAGVSNWHLFYQDVFEVTSPSTNGIIVPTARCTVTAGTATVWLNIVVTAL